MKPALLLLIVGCLVVCSSTFAMTPWERYYQDPTPENARLVDEMSIQEILESSTDLNEAALMVLEVQVRANDKDAIDLAFRLLAKSDGIYGEILSAMLGGLIRPNPRLFLAKLKEHRNKVARLDSLLADFGTVFITVYTPRAEQYELTMRNKALKSVGDKSLRTVRNECLAEISSQLGARTSKASNQAVQRTRTASAVHDYHCSSSTVLPASADGKRWAAAILG
jgi:hypothetical protein